MKTPTCTFERFLEINEGNPERIAEGCLVMLAGGIWCEDMGTPVTPPDRSELLRWAGLSGEPGETPAIPTPPPTASEPVAGQAAGQEESQEGEADEQVAGNIESQGPEGAEGEERKRFVVVRSAKHSPFSWISKAAEDRALLYGGPILLQVYHALCRLESDSPQKKGFYASANNIKSRTKLSVRTIKSTIPQLVEAGLATVESGRFAGENGAHEANRFTLLDYGQKSTPCAGDAQALMQAMHKPLCKKRGSKIAHIKETRKGLKKERRALGGRTGFALPSGTADDEGLDSVDRQLSPEETPWG